MATRKRRKVRADAKRSERSDGYVNESTGLGDYRKDKVRGGKEGPLDFLVSWVARKEAESRWRGSDLGSRIVEAVPSEMLREWFDITVKLDEEEMALQGEAPDGTEPDESPDDEPTEPDIKLPVEEPPTAPGEDTVKEPAPPQQDKPRTDAFPPQFGHNGANGFGKPPAFGQPPVLMVPPPKEKPKAIQETSADKMSEISEELQGKLEELGARQALWKALCYERAYGGSAIYMGVDDGKKPDQPLDETRISELRFLSVFMGGRDGEVLAHSYYTDLNEPKFGEPELYEIRNIGVPTTGKGGVPATTRMLVHESRLLVFDGQPVSREAKYNNHGWGDSIFTRVEEVLSAYNQTWSGVANLLTDFSQGVLKVEGLAKMLAGRNKAADGQPIWNRANVMQQTRSIARMLLIDKDEEFKRETASLAGIGEVLQQFALRLSAAADMPVTLLMGQSPAGLSATGESDIRFYYDRVASAQKRRVEPQVKCLVRILMLTDDSPTEGEEPETWSVCFRPLYQMTEVEKAQVRKTQAETDKIYIDAQVLTPEEVAASAFGGSEYSTERVIDFEGRAAMEAQDKAAAAERQAAMAKQMGQDPTKPGETPKPEESPKPPDQPPPPPPPPPKADVPSEPQVTP